MSSQNFNRAIFPARFSKRLHSGLFILRVALGLFLLLWAIEKFVAPTTTAAIWESFYKIPIGGAVITLLAILQTILAIALLIGFWRPVSYGISLGINAVTVISTWQQLINPWGAEVNHLFLAGIPVLAGFIALYLLYPWDEWSVDGWIAKRRMSRAQQPQQPQ
ncbi:MAG: DoxX family protein [Cyanobacteria bacterium P01_D01_bin.44]